MKDPIHLWYQKAMRAAERASDEIVKVYQNDEISSVAKEDDTPLTQADRNAHQVISEILSQTGIPIISEEGDIPDYAERKDMVWYWLVDPLDGTREFLKRNDEFTVNIALLHHNKPVWGIIQAPVLGQVWFTGEEGKAYRKELKTGKVVPIKARRKPGKPLKVIASRSHINEDTRVAIKSIEKKMGRLVKVSRGSSLKFCMLAEGSADLYPRMGPTMEWDTAAGHAIALAAGCRVLEYPGLVPLKYNKQNLRNPYFIAFPEDYPVPV